MQRRSARLWFCALGCAGDRGLLPVRRAPLALKGCRGGGKCPPPLVAEGAAHEMLKGRSCVGARAHYEA